MSATVLMFGVAMPIFIGLLYLGWSIHMAAIEIARGLRERRN